MSGRKLLTIAQAADLLGVHPRTLREWANQGHVHHIQTPGGHRRFLEADLLGFLEKMGQGREDRSLATAARNAVRDAILQRPQSQPQPASGFPPDLSPEQRAAMRPIGRKLVGLVIRYAAGHTEETVLDEARQLGAAYGAACRGTGMTVSQTVAAFNFFRAPIIDATFASERESGKSEPNKRQLYQRLDRFFNEVLLATVRAVENPA